MRGKAYIVTPFTAGSVTTALGEVVILDVAAVTTASMATRAACADFFMFWVL
jgi:hypothetical protein